MRLAIRNTARLVVCSILVVAAGAAMGSARQPYDPAAFKAAQAAGKPVLVEVHADWCAECKAQNLVLNKLSTEPVYASLLRFHVDYDRQKEFVKAFGARKQSTLILYKGDKEVSRATGITSEGEIRELLSKAL